MGMTENQLVADAVGHIVQIEAPRVLLNGGVKEDLQQHVAQLLFQVDGVLLVDGLGHLAGFFDKDRKSVV